MTKQILHKGKWLSFGEIHSPLPSGNIKKWEFVTRSGSLDGVCIIPFKRDHNGIPGTLILIRQFRPPINAEIIEFPAGLIDPGQTAEESALRELREETGYTGRILSAGPPIFNTPGMADENVVSFLVEVGEKFDQQTEETENIEVLELPFRDLKKQLLELHERGIFIDAKVWSFAEGMDIIARTVVPPQ
ncbi:MAG: NUDIX domain-containing protein [Chthoniobacterales bacterium]